MKVNVQFDDSSEKFIRYGYEQKQHRIFDEHHHTLNYSSIPEYIKIGKKVNRRKTKNNFFDSWGVAIFWLIAILTYFAWSGYGDYQKSSEVYQNTSTSTQGLKNDDDSRSSSSDNCPITTCSDGSCSNSSGRGTCSHHGGVRF